MKTSILAKTLAAFIVIIIILLSLTVVVNNLFLSETILNQYGEMATGFVESIAVTIDTHKVENLVKEVKRIYSETETKVPSSEWGSPEFDAYLDNYKSVEESEDFIVVRDNLRKVEKEVSVDCFYIAYVDPVDEVFVYVVDSSEDWPCRPGCIDELYEQNKPNLQDPEYGFPSYITKTEEYGYLLTSGVTLHNEDGDVIGYVLTDISMNEIVKEKNSVLTKLVIILILTMLVSGTVIYFFLNFTLVKPIKKLSKAAASYYEETSDFNEEKHVFQDIKVNTHDELETLSESMKKMEKDINSHIKKLVSVNSELHESKQFGNKMLELANKDSLTGIKNKTAFDNNAVRINEQIEKGEAEFALVMFDLNNLKVINDTYGHKAGDEAIIDLANLICEVFGDTLVFRIGGDEFVVIVEKDDIENIKAHLARFNKKTEKLKNNTTLQPWKRISSASGYAVFEKDRDQSLADTLRRADKEMYKNKSEMKKSAK